MPLAPTSPWSAPGPESACADWCAPCRALARLLDGGFRTRLALHAHFHRDGIARQPLGLRQNRHALDHVAQFARVARPAVALEQREYALVQRSEEHTSEL